MCSIRRPAVEVLQCRHLPVKILPELPRDTRLPVHTPPSALRQSGVEQKGCIHLRGCKSDRIKLKSSYGFCLVSVSAAGGLEVFLIGRCNTGERGKPRAVRVNEEMSRRYRCRSPKVQVELIIFKQLAKAREEPIARQKL